MGDSDIRRAERDLASVSPEEAEAYLVNARRRGEMETPVFSLQQLLEHQDWKSYCKKHCEGCKDGWYHSKVDGFPYGRSELIEYFAPRIKVEHFERVGSYQGTCYALLKIDVADGFWALWTDYFGSCSGCDGLQAADSPKEVFEYIKATLAEGNTKSFWTLRDACEYLLTTEEWRWSPHHRIDDWDDGFYNFLEALWKKTVEYGEEPPILPPVETFHENPEED
mgnify:CR=1 FL=1